MRCLRGLVPLVVAIVAAVLLPIPAMAIETPAEAAPVVYVYDAQYNAVDVTSAATERGPPAAHDRNIDHGVDGHKLAGALARPNLPPTTAANDYYDLARLVHSARGSHRAEGQVGAEPSSAVVLRSEVAANGGGDLTRVGRWMSRDEHAAMVRTNEVQVGGGGTTYVSHPPSIDVWRRQASPGSVYVEFDVPRSVLRPGGQPGHAQIPSPSHPLYGRLAEKSGVPLQYPVQACNIVLVGSC